MEYYSISQTAALLEETPVTIRFWSNTFTKHLRPKRNLKGDRFFSTKDIEVLKQVKHYARDCGFSLQAINKKLTRSASGQDTNALIRESLLRMKAQLEEIKASL